MTDVDGLHLPLRGEGAGGAATTFGSDVLPYGARSVPLRPTALLSWSSTPSRCVRDPRHEAPTAAIQGDSGDHWFDVEPEHEARFGMEGEDRWSAKVRALAFRSRWPAPPNEDELIDGSRTALLRYGS